MIRFNIQTAVLIENKELCKKIFDSFQLGQSYSYIANKYNVTRYAVKRIAELWNEKGKPHWLGAVIDE